MINTTVLEHIRINNDATFKLLYHSEDTHLSAWKIIIVCEAARITDVVDAFTKINKIELLQSDGETVKKILTKFGTYDSLNINPRNVYQDEVGNNLETMSLTLKAADLETTVKKLEATVFPTVNYGAMSIEEYRDTHIAKLGKECEAKIFAGTDVETAYGEEHFSATFSDQQNIKTLADVAMAAKVALPYHADNSQCKVYSCEDIIKIYCAIQKLVLVETTYCNALNTYVRSLTEKADISKVVYGKTELPAEIAEAMEATIVQGEAVMDAIAAMYLTPAEGTGEEVAGEPEKEAEAVPEESVPKTTK